MLLENLEWLGLNGNIGLEEKDSGRELLKRLSRPPINRLKSVAMSILAAKSASDATPDQEEISSMSEQSTITSSTEKKTAQRKPDVCGQFVVPDCSAIAMWGVDSALRSMPKCSGAPSPRSRDPFLEAHRVPSTWSGCSAALQAPVGTARSTVGSALAQEDESTEAQEQLYDCRGLIQVRHA